MGLQHEPPSFLPLARSPATASILRMIAPASYASNPPSSFRARPRRMVLRTPAPPPTCSFARLLVRWLAGLLARLLTLPVRSPYPPARPKRLIIARRSEETSTHRRQAEDHWRAGTLSAPAENDFCRLCLFWWRCCCCTEAAALRGDGLKGGGGGQSGRAGRESGRC